MDPLSSFKSVCFDPCNRTTLGKIIESIVIPKTEHDFIITLLKQDDELSSRYIGKKGILVHEYDYKFDAYSINGLSKYCEKNYDNIKKITFKIADNLNIELMENKKIVQNYNGEHVKTFQISLKAFDNDTKNEILKVVQTNFSDKCIVPGICA